MIRLNYKENIYSWIDHDAILEDLPSHMKSEFLYLSIFKMIENI